MRPGQNWTSRLLSLFQITCFNLRDFIDWTNQHKTSSLLPPLFFSLEKKKNTIPNKTSVPTIIKIIRKSDQTNSRTHNILVPRHFHSQDYSLQAGSEERLLNQIESLGIDSSSSFLFHFQCAWVAFTTSSCPCPKLASLNTDIAGFGFINLRIYIHTKINLKCLTQM